MPSSRRLKATLLLALLALLTLYYISRGASSTHSSPFYTRTVAAMQARESADARREILAEERQRLQRVERVEREHRVAMSVAADGEKAAAAAAAAAGTTKGATTSSSSGSRNPYEQKPIVPGAPVVPAGPGQSGKPVAGRKMMGGDGGKVVQASSNGRGDSDDGVAKVGNVGPQSSHAVVAGESEAEEKEKQKVEAALNDILRKGPIIVFSKSYCPFSKKAKHILLDLYTITPPPYVVELDQHELGSGLQAALAEMTGRRTVPNVLVNGRSIGGGDDVEELHDTDKLIGTLSSMGGKRIVKIVRNEEESEDDGEKKTEMKRFKA